MKRYRLEVKRDGKIIHLNWIDSYTVETVILAGAAVAMKYRTYSGDYTSRIESTVTIGNMSYTNDY